MILRLLSPYEYGVTAEGIDSNERHARLYNYFLAVVKYNNDNEDFNGAITADKSTDDLFCDINHTGLYVFTSDPKRNQSAAAAQLESVRWFEGNRKLNALFLSIYREGVTAASERTQYPFDAHGAHEAINDLLRFANML